jgi:hypothetical protein
MEEGSTATSKMLYSVNNNNNNNNNNLFTAIGLLPGGSGYFTCIQNMTVGRRLFH